mgnify:CR=1 FL=1|jgi:hypothetical protein
MIGFAVVRNVEFLFFDVVMDFINIYDREPCSALVCYDEKTTPIHGRVGFNPYDCLRWRWR